MKVETGFTVPCGIDDAWKLLLDVPRVVPCMPGAELVSTTSDDAWRARLSTRLGPAALGFDADVVRERVDERKRSVVLTVAARERRGSGNVRARIVSTLGEDGDETTANVSTELALTGRVAAIGRQGLIEDVAAQMTDQFAANLREELLPGTSAEGDADAAGAPAEAASGRPAERRKPPSTTRMLVGLVLRKLIRLLEGILARVERRRGPGAPEAP